MTIRTRPDSGPTYGERVGAYARPTGKVRVKGDEFQVRCFEPDGGPVKEGRFRLTGTDLFEAGNDVKGAELLAVKMGEALDFPLPQTKP